MLDSNLSTFMCNENVRPYQLDESVLKTVWVVIYHFFQILKIHSVNKVTYLSVHNLIRHSTLRRLIWFCTVCTVGFNQAPIIRYGYIK